MKAIDLLTHEVYSIKVDPKPFGYTDADELTVTFTVLPRLDMYRE